MIRLAIRVRSADAEVVLAELLALVPAGLEERELGDGSVEYAIYGAPGELPQLPELQASVGEALVEVSTSELPDDWSERWKHFHRPVLVEPPAAVAREGGVPALHLRAPWHAAAVGPGALEIVIDPGQAFGTGSHATTRLCLELLLALASEHRERGPVLDVGCGSGVLAIASSLLGYAPVHAVDLERASVLATRENAQRNSASVAVERLDVRQGIPTWRTAPVVLANLVRPLLAELAWNLPGPPPHVIASGLLVHEVDEIVEVYRSRFSLLERERRLSPEWAAVWLSAPSARP
jgi:ribosomal protein L11 methyltransferase